MYTVVLHCNYLATRAAPHSISPKNGASHPPAVRGACGRGAASGWIGGGVRGAHERTRQVRALSPPTDAVPLRSRPSTSRRAEADRCRRCCRRRCRRCRRASRRGAVCSGRASPSSAPPRPPTARCCWTRRSARSSHRSSRPRPRRCSSSARSSVTPPSAVGSSAPSGSSRRQRRVPLDNA